MANDCCMEDTCHCSDDDCGNYSMPSDGLLIAMNEEFNKKKSFRQKFEIVSKFFAPSAAYMHTDHGKHDKRVTESKRWRIIGNREYKSKNNDYLIRSIKAFTKSVAAAPLKSKELSLAYANRSAALLKARLFEDCLLDIERALASGYPDNLKAKLFARQSLCFHALMPSLKLESKIPLANTFQWLPAMNRKDPSYSTVFNILTNYKKFSKSLGKPRDNVNTGIFIPKVRNKNSNIIGASDGIAIKTTRKNGQHVVATRDIKAGEFIYADKPLEIIICDEKRFTHCWHCCEETCCGLPCDNCPNVIFCSQACKDASWKEYHDLECPVLGSAVRMEYGTKYHIAVRIMARALKAAGSLNALKKQIDDIDLKPKSRTLADGSLALNSLENFHRLPYFPADSEVCSLSVAMNVMQCVIMFGIDTTVLGKKMSLVQIHNDKNTSILGELILRYMMIVEHNVVFFTGAVTEDPSNYLNAAIIPVLNEFKHSCDPHVNWYSYGTNVAIAVERPIKEGETVYFSSVGRYQDKPKGERNLALSQFMDVPCQCFPCVKNLGLQDSLPSYQKMGLPTTVKNKLDANIIKSRDYFQIISNGDPKQLSKIMNNLIVMTNTFHQYITKPCQEVSEVSFLLGLLYHQLGVRRSILA